MNEIINAKLLELQKTYMEFWNISPEVGKFLNLLIKTGNYKNILEVGTSNGYSAIWLALALQESDGHLVTIEFWEDRKEMAKKNLEECNLLNKVTLLQGSAIDVLEKLGPEIYKSQDNKNKTFVDFAFIDASKIEYIEYFNKIHPILNKNGIIVADNIISHENKVFEYIDTINSHEDYQTVKLNIGSGLLVSLKIN